MLAIRVDNGRASLVGDHPLPSRAGEARVRVRLAGICATDLEIVRGYMGFVGVPGHEWVGVVEQCDAPAWVGQRVVGEINVGCGSCNACHAGNGRHCARRTVQGIVGRDGAFAEHLALPLANLHRVPDDIPDEAAVFVEPLAAACAILEQVHIRPTDRVAILGAGRLGQLCARVIERVGAEVVVVSRGATRTSRLPPQVRWAAAADAGDLPEQDIVVECTGSIAGLTLAGQMLRPQGTLVLKTTVSGSHDLGLAPWVIHEFRVVGSRCGPFAPALRLLAGGGVDPRPLIDEEFPLDRGVEALARAAMPGVLKVVLRP